MDLSIFNDIKIENTTRLCEKDLKAIEKLQQEFGKDKNFHFKLKNLIENEFEGEEDLYGYSDFTKNKLRESNYNAFINRAWKFQYDIYNYFNKKYSCKLGKEKQKIYTNDSDKEYNAYNNTTILKSNELLAKYENLNYQDILDNIFDELGGITFEDKRIVELQQFLKEQTKQWGSKQKKVIIRNKKLTINDYFYLDHFDLKYGSVRISYQCYDRIEKLLESIDIFNNNTLNVKEFVDNMRNNKGQIINTYEYNLDKTKSIKFFKNGRIDITFTSNKDVIEYSKEFLNYEV